MPTKKRSELAAGVFVLVALVVLLGVSVTPPHVLRRWTPWAYGVGLLLVAATWVVGEGVGADRWLAMLGAWAQARGACVVVDAGTALTVDIIDSGGRHRGGIIAAGLHTSRAALLGATRFATRDAPPPEHAGLGTDTESCVDQGALLSCLGAIDRAAAAEPQARRFITGGDARRLLPHLGADWDLQSDLVLRGLWHRATLD